MAHRIRDKPYKSPWLWPVRNQQVVVTRLCELRWCHAIPHLHLISVREDATLLLENLSLQFPSRKTVHVRAMCPVVDIILQGMVIVRCYLYYKC